MDKLIDKDFAREILSDLDRVIELLKEIQSMDKTPEVKKPCCDYHAGKVEKKEHKKKVWIGYGVMLKDDLLTHSETGNMAIFSVLDMAKASRVFYLNPKSLIVKLYMSLEEVK